MTAAEIGAGVLRQTINQARDESGLTLDALTVLDPDLDPYRFDRPAGHALGHWFADQVARFVAPGRAIHLRGLHYAIVAAADVAKPTIGPGSQRGGAKGGKAGGSLYRNTDDDWEWLCEYASNAARWLEYVSFDRIRDERNAAPQIFVPEDEGVVEVELDRGISLQVPSLIEALPAFTCTGFTARQPYRIAMVGEKSSLSDVLLPIAQNIGAELLLPSGDLSTTMTVGLATRAVEDGRPCVVLYFSDFDPSGFQMPAAVARKLQALRDLLFPRLHIEVHAVALSRQHVAELDLPSTPLKETEFRASRWRQAWGVEQTEIDALAALRPDVLRQIALDAIKPFYDDTLDDRVADAERRWLDDAAERLFVQRNAAALREQIRTALNKVRAAAKTLAAAQERARELLAGVEPPEVEIPEPVIGAEAAEPLFTTDTNFVEATQKLKARKTFNGG